MLGYNQATGTFTLGNPWGIDAKVNGLAGGVLNLTTQQLFANFRSFAEVNPSEAITTLDTILHTQEIPQVWPAVIVDWIPNIIDYEIPVLRDTITIESIRLVEFRSADAVPTSAPEFTLPAGESTPTAESHSELEAVLTLEAVFADRAAVESLAKPDQAGEWLDGNADDLPVALLDDLFAELAAA
jgi:hypothetical protein